MANHCSFNNMVVWRKISEGIFQISSQKSVTFWRNNTSVKQPEHFTFCNRNYAILNIFPQYTKKAIAFSPGETLLIHMQLLLYLFRLRMFTVKSVSARKRFWIHWTHTSNPPLSAILQYLVKNITAGKINE